MEVCVGKLANWGEEETEIERKREGK
ncbi:uncharacterized protein G2W53_020956 [Senna tora]|uniref:Uncharacterized protein n=1 Tax=Senna tora TaxID=362788 RepID=A0A834TK78_9FABA|nr:uncharacterized protein G2W53_020956 [Senna tora]